jgi:hypothetical protein
MSARSLSLQPKSTTCNAQVWQEQNYSLPDRHDLFQAFPEYTDE